MNFLWITTLFGEEPKNHYLPAKGIIEQVQQEITTFCGKQPQFDDITLVILKTL
ncbi:hypothetical protein KKG61_03095 [bacterium]|nr:hypothetical protein [bacterium]